MTVSVPAEGRQYRCHGNTTKFCCTLKFHWHKRQLIVYEQAEAPGRFIPSPDENKDHTCYI